MLLIRLSVNPFWSGVGPDEGGFVQALQPLGIDAAEARTSFAALIRNETADLEVPEDSDLRGLADSIPAFTIELPDQPGQATDQQ